MHETSEYIVGTLLAAVIFCGLSGNALVAYSILKERRLLQSNYYFLVLNLAICDAFHVLSGLRLNLRSWLTAWPLREAAACKIWMCLEMLLCHCGVYLMTIICVFRYRAVLHPFKHPISRRKLKLIPLFLFITISIYLIPYVLVFEYNPLTGCTQEWPNKTLKLIYTLLSLNVHFILPVTIMSVLYYKICKALISQAKEMNSMLQAETGSRTQQPQVRIQGHFRRARHHRNTKAFLISVVSVSIFTITLIPFETWWISNVNGFNGFGILKNEHAAWFYLSYMIGSSTVNPFIYGVLDKKLVEGLKCRNERNAGDISKRINVSIP